MSPRDNLNHICNVASRSGSTVGKIAEKDLPSWTDDACEQLLTAFNSASIDETLSPDVFDKKALEVFKYLGTSKLCPGRPVNPNLIPGSLHHIAPWEELIDTLKKAVINDPAQLHTLTRALTINGGMSNILNDPDFIYLRNHPVRTVWPGDVQWSTHGMSGSAEDPLAKFYNGVQYNLPLILDSLGVSNSKLTSGENWYRLRIEPTQVKALRLPTLAEGWYNLNTWEPGGQTKPIKHGTPLPEKVHFVATWDSLDVSRGPSVEMLGQT